MLVPKHPKLPTKTATCDGPHVIPLKSLPTAISGPAAAKQLPTSIRSDMASDPSVQAPQSLGENTEAVALRQVGDVVAEKQQNLDGCCDQGNAVEGEMVNAPATVPLHKEPKSVVNGAIQEEAPAATAAGDSVPTVDQPPSSGTTLG